MEFIRSLYQLRPHHQPCVATMGNFDGFHLAHQKILQQLKKTAVKMNLPVMVIIFEPQAKEFFAHADTPARLTRLREKLVLFQQFGIDRVLCLRFNTALASLSADQFIQRVLVDGLAIKHLLVGDDFRFGQRRLGDFALLQEAGAYHGFTVADTPSVRLLPLNAAPNAEKQRVSSSWVRTVLAAGDMQSAHYLLGRPYAMAGRVGHGQKKGRLMGFPTANIRLQRDISPLFGVFAVQMHGVADKPLAGVANLGTRPTVNGGFPLLEVHLFDFQSDIYRRPVSVDFLHRLRAEQRFSSFNQLKQQIAIDTLQAKAYFQALRQAV